MRTPGAGEEQARRRGPASWILGAAALAGLPLACNIEPDAPTVRFDLAEATREVDPDSGFPVVPPQVQEHIRGALEMLFGTPSHPQYMLTEQWADDGFDPNYPTYEVGDRGSGELLGEDLERLHQDNLRLFRRQLEAIARGDYGAVEVPDTAPDLRLDWRDLLGDTPPEERGEEFREEAAALFRGWYPTLRDSAELYRVQCLHCHGASGGGDGPTADFLDPRPRDYRLGVYKFTAVKDKARPRRADLHRILDEGVTGTAMPSFRRFGEAELHGLVDYVRLLSVRGEVERSLAQTAKDEDPVTMEAVQVAYADTWERWIDDQDDEKLIVAQGDVPPPTPESIARGREIYMDATTGNCFSCHGDGGRGDGVAAWQMDELGARVPAYKDDWGRPIFPRDLTYGLFRGGRRPIDIYRRIYAGINGTPMPALGEAKDAEGNPLLSEADLWAVVHYVGTLSEQAGGHATASAAGAADGHGGGQVGGGH